MAMTRNPSTQMGVRPTNRSMAVVLSLIVVLLATAASVAGLLIDGVYAGDAAVAEMLRGYDLVTLVLAVPALSVFLVRRDRALLVWTGTLAYLTDTYAFAVFGTAFNDLFLLHTAVSAPACSASCWPSRRRMRPASTGGSAHARPDGLSRRRAARGELVLTTGDQAAGDGHSADNAARAR
jgi:hypothetical protein